MSNLDDFDAPPADEPFANEKQPSARTRLSEALKTNPAFKIFLILVAVGALASAAMGVFGSSEKAANTSVVRGGGATTSTPGGEASPAFQQAVQEANRQRAEDAARAGASALPTPLGGQTQITTLDPAINTALDDPLAEFKVTQVDESAPRALAPAAPPPSAFDPAPQAVMPAPPIDQNKIQAMSGKMQQVMAGLQPAPIRVMQVTAPTVDTPDANAGGLGGQEFGQQQQDPARILVPAGTINYGQLLVEANSDMPSSIMAQIMSGPLKGGRAIGSFQTTDEHLVLRFTLVNMDGVDYPVDILALDPSTTQSGIVTEYDPRYWSRVFLPAAADFISGFADAFAQADQSVTVQDGVVISSRAGASLRQAFGEGTARVGDGLAEVLEDQGRNVQPLIRVATGTPLGLFFVQSVYEEPQNNMQAGGFGGGFGFNPYSGQFGGNQFGGNQFGGAGVQGFGGPFGGSGLNSFGTGTGLSGMGNPGTNLGTGGFNNFSGQGFNQPVSNRQAQQIAPGVTYYGSNQ